MAWRAGQDPGQGELRNTFYLNLSSGSLSQISDVKMSSVLRVPCVSLTPRPGHHWLSLSPTSALRSHARQPPPATRTRTLGLSSAPQLLQTDWRLTEVAIREFGGIRPYGLLLDGTDQ